jgi:hypothetical protein
MTKYVHQGPLVSGLVMSSIDNNYTQISNSGNMCYIPFERAKLALSNVIYSFLWERAIVVKKRKKEKIVVFSSLISTKSYTKIILNFEKTFSVCRAFNSKHFDKKKFLKSTYFDGVRLKIL